MSWAWKTLSSELDDKAMGLNSSASESNSNMSAIDEHWGLNSQGTSRRLYLVNLTIKDNANAVSDTVDERLNREDLASRTPKVMGENVLSRKQIDDFDDFNN